MDDILIVSSCESKAAKLWVDYFITCFEQYSKHKGKPKIMQLGLEEITSGSEISQSLLERIAGVKLQLVIVCPRFLELVEEHPIPSSTFGKCLRPDRTIAMLLGVTDDNLNEIHHAALTNYRQWQRHIVGQDQDENFTRDFLTAAIKILTKVANQEQQQSIEDRTTFSVMPKKVKQSQNRLIILLDDPLTKDDVVKISVNKNGEMIEIKSVKRRNPYTLKFVMPESCLEVSLIVRVMVEKNGDVLGVRPVKCESRLRELDQILRSSDSPLEFMCQTLGFSPSSREQLDHWMVHNFQKNLPPHFNLLSSSSSPHSLEAAQSLDEYPTLLHFAARFGLEKLSWQLLECPGGDLAIDTRNVCGLTPAEMADAAGNTRLASTLSGYMQMNEFTNMYSKLKEMTETKAVSKPEANFGPDVDDDDYLLPRGVEQTYCIPPPAKPIVSSVSSYDSTMSTRAFTGYLEMQQPGKGPSSNKGTLTKTKEFDIRYNSQITTSSQRLQSIDSSNSKSAISLSTYEDKVQGELLEIINDFKNNVYSLSDVEQLVENWRNRNDVQNSFRDKQEQLNFMREEYNRIQQVIKEKMKRPTPFDRIKSFFSRSKSKENENSGLNEKVDAINSEDKVSSFLATSNLRPISSLSLQSTTSTSSSGRMSTLSGFSTGSFGDSGTHSDHEERKQLMRQASSDHEYFEISDQNKNQNLVPSAPKKIQNFNYLVPPAPKPVLKYITQKQSNFPPQFTTIDERPPQPVPRIESSISDENDEHYIQFPPSGQPINALLIAEIKARTPSPLPPPDDQSEYLSMLEQPEYHDVEEHLQEYMNVSHSEQYEEEQPEYSNLQDNLPNYINMPKSPALPPRKA